MYRTHVYLNGQSLKPHDGSFADFSYNITGDVVADTRQTLVVSCWNPANKGPEPCGKQQVGKPGFTMHLVSTGIWQTVWLETVPQVYIKALRITPSVRTQQVSVTPLVRRPHSHIAVRVAVLRAGQVIAEASGTPDRPVLLTLLQPQLWSPNHPFLYTLKVELVEKAGVVMDTVTSYFAMRSIRVQKGADGHPRIFLNGKPCFLLGPLEEGYWPDGAYTPPSNAAMKFDIQAMRSLGFNMCRKHEIVAPQRWYYLCDRLGLMVWQDMPAAFDDKTAASQAEFKRELTLMLRQLHNHPCVVMWTLFNEGWGQHDTNTLARWIKRRDPSRLIDPASGWTDHGYGDVKDAHIYSGPGMWPAMADRASVLGESGRFACPIGGHIWRASWAVFQHNVPARGTAASNKLRAAWFVLYKKWALALMPLIRRGLAAAVYTRFADQISDHCTGLITCDRGVFKAREASIAGVNREVLRYAQGFASPGAGELSQRNR